MLSPYGFAVWVEGLSADTQAVINALPRRRGIRSRSYRAGQKTFLFKLFICRPLRVLAWRPCGKPGGYRF